MTEIIIILFLIASIILVSFYFFNKSREYMVNITPVTRKITWGKDNTCKYAMTKIMTDELNNNEITESVNNDWVVYFPCTYNDIKSEINKVKPTQADQRIFIINDADQLSSKSNLWENLVAKFGRDEAKKMSPVSYVLYNPQDMKLFETEYDTHKLYILKKNIQRQEGLKITNNKEEIKNANKHGYVVVQELLQDPYIVNGRKINMRFYVLVVCQNNEVSAYVHKEGFMYYTKMPYCKQSLEDAPNITTGYIERWVYAINPLTHSEFREYLDVGDRKLTDQELDIIEKGDMLSETTFNKIYELLKNVVIAVSPLICQETHLKSYITFQLFGADIALNEQLEPMIMEVNKGPALDCKDDKDCQVKHKVVNDVFKIMKISKNNDDHNFIKVLD
jgi:Tubulin-tyrosine ligase family